MKRSNKQSSSTTTSSQSYSEEKKSSTSYSYNEQTFLGREVESALDEILAETGSLQESRNNNKIVSVKSTKTPSMPKKSYDAPVKDGFVKVTVSSGSNELNHFSRSLSQEDIMTDDDIFDDVSSVESEIEVEECEIESVDASIKQLSGERSFEEIYGKEEVDSKTKMKTLNIELQRDTSVSPRDYTDFHHSPSQHISSTYPNNLPIDISVTRQQEQNKIRVLVSPHQTGFVPVHSGEDARHKHASSQQQRVEYQEQSSKIKPIAIRLQNNSGIYDNVIVTRSGESGSMRKSSLPDGMDEQEFRRETDLQLQKQKEMMSMYQQRVSQQQQERQRRLSDQQQQQNYYQQQLVQHQQHLQRITQQQEERQGRQQQRQQAKESRDKVILNGSIMRRHSFDNTSKIEREDEEHLRQIHRHDSRQKKQVNSDLVILNGSMRRHSFNNNDRERQNEENRRIYEEELRQIQIQKKQNQSIQQQHQQVTKKVDVNQDDTSLIMRRLSYEQEIGRLEEQILKLQQEETSKVNTENNVQHNRQQQQYSQTQNKKYYQQQQLQQQQQQRLQQDRQNYKQIQTFKTIPHSNGVRSATNTPLHHTKFESNDDQFMFSTSANNTPSAARKRGKIPSNVRSNKFQSEDIISHEHNIERRRSNPNIILGRTETKDQETNNDVQVKKTTNFTHSYTLPRSFGRQKKNMMDNQMKSTATTVTTVQRSSSTRTSKDAKDTGRKISFERPMQRPNSTTKSDELRMNQAQQKLNKQGSKTTTTTNQVVSINTSQQKQQQSSQKSIQQQQQQQLQLQKHKDLQNQQKLQQLQQQQQHQQQQHQHLQQQIQELQQQQQYQQQQQQQLEKKQKAQVLQQQLQDLKNQYTQRVQQHQIETTHQHINSTSSTKNTVSFEDTGLNIINGSHVRNTLPRPTKKSHAFTQLSRPKPEPIPVKPKVIESKPKYRNENVQSIKVQAKGGEISLILENEQDEWEFSDEVKKQIATNMYGSHSSGHRHYHQNYHHNSIYNADYLNTSTETAVDVTDGNMLSSEIVYYTVCTHYFKPENYDYIQDIHRMGKIRVPQARRHQEKCVFWNGFFNPDKEEIVVSKQLVPEEKKQRKISTTSVQIITDSSMQQKQQQQQQQQQYLQQHHNRSRNNLIASTSYQIQQTSPRKDFNNNNTQHHRQHQQHYGQQRIVSMPNVQITNHDIQQQQRQMMAISSTSSSKKMKKSWVEQAFDDKRDTSGISIQYGSHHKQNHHQQHTRVRKDSVESDSPFDTAFDARSIDSELAVHHTSMRFAPHVSPRSIHNDMMINKAFSSDLLFQNPHDDDGRNAKKYSIQNDYPKFVKRRLSQSELRDEF